jgi:tetratricopeptide (TPR) repeat protein
MIRPSALQPLFDAFLNKTTGTLEVRGGWSVGVRAGKIVQVEGRPELLPTRRARGDLMKDMAAAVEEGMSPEQAFGVAEAGLGRALVELAEDPSASARFTSRVPPSGAFPLPTPIPRLVGNALSEPGRYGSGDLDALREHRVCAGVPVDDARALAPIEQRLLQLAPRRARLGKLVDAVSKGDERRARRVWNALEMMLAGGLLTLDDPSSAPASAGQSASGRSVSGAEALRAAAIRQAARQAAAREASGEPDARRDAASQPRRLSERERRILALRERIAQRKADGEDDDSTVMRPRPAPRPEASARIDRAAARPAPREPSEQEKLRAVELVLQSKEPLEVLELHEAPTLTVDSLSAAFREIGGRYHPDRFNGKPEAVQESAARIFAIVTAAYDALKEPDALEYARNVLQARARGEVYVDEMSAAKARVFFRKAEAASRQRNRSAAAELVDQAVALDPRHAEYRILQVFAHAVLGDLPPGESLKELAEIDCKTVGEQLNKNLTAGQLLKMDDRPDEAVEYFRKVLETQPGHPEAKREVWLYERRSSGGSDDSAPQGGGGRLSNLFSRRS